MATITGTTKNDVLTGTSGNDTLNGLAGADTMSGGLGNDTYIVDNVSDVVIELANAGIDTVQASVSYTIGANIENLTLTGTAAINATGNDLANTILGNSKNNVLNGGLGADTMKGGDGNDTYYVDNIADVVLETNANALVGGTDNVVTTVSYTLGANLENMLLAGLGSITGVGNGLNNYIEGNAAANFLDGGLGADTMKGGDGNDTYYVDSIADVVLETNANALVGGTDNVVTTVSYTLGANLENMLLAGSGSITGVGNELNNYIEGNAAANFLDGGLGVDIMKGGDGNDTYYVDSIADVVLETNANALVGGTDNVVTTVSYTLGANLENMLLAGLGSITGVGNELNNYIEGNAAANFLDGGLGADTMKGGDGNDTYYVDNIADVVLETNANALVGGTDNVVTTISYTLGANLENMLLAGLGSITGVGNELNNYIEGNAGYNVINGLGGSNTLCGGDGEDTYVLNSSVVANDTIIENSGYNLIQATLGATAYNTHNLGLAQNVAMYEVTLLDAGAYSFSNAGSFVTQITDFQVANIAINQSVVLNLSPDPTTNGYMSFVSALIKSSAGLTTVNGTTSDDSIQVASNGGSVAINAGSGNDLIDISNPNYFHNHTSPESGGIVPLAIDLVTIDGGAGNDSFYIYDSPAQVTIIEGLNGGIDTVHTAQNFTGLTDNVENLYFDIQPVNGSVPVTGFTGFGNALDNTIVGNSGADYLDGKDGNDTLIGGAGNDILLGGNGSDAMYGGLGDDVYHVNVQADQTFELASSGNDTVYADIIGGDGIYLYANIENLVLTGSTSFGVGNELANDIQGNGLANWLLGGAGDDILNGKAGNDVLWGEAGADLFIFERGTGADVICDFTPGVDQISLSGIYTSFSQIQSHMVQNGADMGIDLGNGDILVLLGISMSAMTPAVFGL
jgi:Ca2+-binding RTX toxin-like protein